MNGLNLGLFCFLGLGLGFPVSMATDLTGGVST